MPSDAGASAATGNRRLVLRFTATERLLHWAHATGFLAMLFTGLLLYLPALNAVLGGRPAAKAAHLAAAIGWLVCLCLIALLGNRTALRASVREIDRLGLEDRAWLRRRPVPQGRFNAGQKLHTVIQAAFAALFVISGTLLWLGERTSDLRFPGTIVLHDGAMYLTVSLLIGHLWLALVWPTTRHAMRGITLGTVRASWAASHHAGWAPDARPMSRRSKPGPGAIALGAAMLVLGSGLAAFVVRDALGGGTSGATPAVAAVQTPDGGGPGTQAAAPGAAARAPGEQLAIEAQALEQSGSLDDAVVRYRLAVRALPGRADIRAALGVALARVGNLEDAIAQLRRATRARPPVPEARLYLGLALQAASRRDESRAQLQHYLRNAKPGPGSDLARDALRRR